MEIWKRQKLDAEYREKGFWRPYSLAEELAVWAECFGERTALVGRGRRMTYKELHRRSERIAAGLEKRGIASGMCAILQFPNSIEYVLAAFACFRLGVIPLLTLPAYRDADIDILCGAVKPTIYFASSRFMGYDYAPLAALMRERHPSLKLFVSDDGKALGSVALESLDGDPRGMPFPAPTDVALVLL